VWPSPESAGRRLSPSEGGGAVPPAWLAKAVTRVQPVVPLELVTLDAHVLRTKTFSIPFATAEERFEAFVENATNWPVAQVPAVPHRLMLGYSATALAGDFPSGVEMSLMLGAQVVPVVAAPVQVS